MAVLESKRGYYEPHIKKAGCKKSINGEAQALTLSEILKNVDNIPEGGELDIDPAEFVRLFRNEIIKKCFKKPAAK